DTQGPQMSDAEWRRKSAAMKATITRLRNAAKSKATLAEKLDAQRKVKAAEAEWHAHRLNYFSLVA
ncbi:MAG TPA: hypothetical protein VJ598_06930, partial [Albitalea sp.]|nr:hypothetical protein [Albitalea sp.]